MGKVRDRKNHNRRQQPSNAPVTTTERSVLKPVNIWSGPGNFRVEDGVSIPIVNDGSIMWSKGLRLRAAEGATAI